MQTLSPTYAAPGSNLLTNKLNRCQALAEVSADAVAPTVLVERANPVTGTPAAFLGGVAIGSAVIAAFSQGSNC